MFQCQLSGEAQFHGGEVLIAGAHLVQRQNHLFGGRVADEMRGDQSKQFDGH